ncbi:MAG: hypothetical protein ABIL76_07205 [candidate division WOR-3 bacterium]
MRFLFPIITIILIACSSGPKKSEEIIIVDSLKVSGKIYVDSSMQTVQNWTIYATYDGNLTISGPTKSSNSKVITFDTIKIGIPSGHENGIVKFSVKVNGIKETRSYFCQGQTPDTFKVNLKVFQNVEIYANNCAYN